MLEYYKEHKYRSTYACSHDEYLNEPVQTVAWLLHIQGLEESLKAEAEARAQKAANAPPGARAGNWPGA